MTDANRASIEQLARHSLDKWLPPPDALAVLLARPRVSFRALDPDDPLDGVDASAKSIRFGRVGEAPGPARTRQTLTDLTFKLYGHIPPFMQVHSEPAGPPPGADETATDPEWGATVKS